MIVARRDQALQQSVAKLTSTLFWERAPTDVAALRSIAGEPFTVRILQYFPMQASVSVRRGQTDTLAGQEYLNHSVLKRSRAQVQGNRVFATHLYPLL
jgi:hypothetical protein